MVPIPLLLNFFTTALTFLEGMIEQVAPLVNKFLDHKANTNKPTIDPNCEIPRCGIHPYFCPQGALSQACIQRNMAMENRYVAQSPTIPSKNRNDDDNDDNEDKSKSMSPGGTIMLVFVLVVILAIIGFVIIRLRQNTSGYSNERNSHGRKSSIGSV